MDKFLYFSSGANNTHCYPVSALKKIDNGASNRLDLFFHPGAAGADGSLDQIKLTIVDASEKTIVQDLVAAINAHPNGDPLVVVADDENGVYVNSNITAVAFTAGS